MTAPNRSEPDRSALEPTSILTLGDRGTIDGQPFTLVGRRCCRGKRGNLWNEWTLSDVPYFLSESAGSFTLYREGPLVTPSDALTPGGPLPWLVVERGTATCLASWGNVEPSVDCYDFVDLSQDTRRASVVEDHVFIGHAVDARDLGLTLAAHPPCLVRVPDVSPPSGLETWLAPGDRGTLEGVEYVVLGVVARTDMQDERWQEYCVYSAGIGVRWLVVSEGHWSYVAPVDAGVAGALDRGDSVGFSKVEWAAGELPWAVRVGEQAMHFESGELTCETTSDEISWSRATALTPDTVARAFNKRALPRPR